MMWGDRSPRAKLTGDSRRGFEAVLIGDCRSFHSLASNWPLRPLRLLKQYRHKTEVPSGFKNVRFSGKTGSHQRTVRMTRLTQGGLGAAFGRHVTESYIGCVTVPDAYRALKLDVRMVGMPYSGLRHPCCLKQASMRGGGRSLEGHPKLGRRYSPARGTLRAGQR